MSRKVIDYTPGPAEYVITYYGCGMTPMQKRLPVDIDLDEALAEFDSMVADPMAGASSMELRQTVARTKYVF